MMVEIGFLGSLKKSFFFLLRVVKVVGFFKKK